MGLPEEFYFLSLQDAAEKIRQREVSCVEVVQGQLERIAKLDLDLASYITVASDAIESAAHADAILTRGEKIGLLHGIPLALKDVIHSKGLPTTANSRVLKNWFPEKDAAIVARLKAAGAIIIGKLNLNEFAWSIPSENDLCCPPRNPWNPSYAAIGSSSGSGAAVAAGLCFGSFGTDAGGSIRLPSASCGLVGMKPTHDRISRRGVLGGKTLMDVGPMARTVPDASILFQVAADETGNPSASGTDISAIRLGIPWKEIEAAGVNPEIQAALDAALHEFETMGASIRPVTPRWMAEARAANFLILNAEEYSLHERSLREQLNEYGLSASLYLLQGAFLSSADYLRALQVQSIVTEEIDRLFESVDILVMPVSPFLTPDAAREPSAHRRGVGAAFTAPFNLTGHPALSMPCGLSSVGLPMGLQLVGRKREEAMLLHAADRFQQQTGWTSKHPSVSFSLAGQRGNIKEVNRA